MFNHGAHDLGSLALSETLQAIVQRIFELGFIKGVIGSLLIFWLLFALAVVLLVCMSLYIERRQINWRERMQRDHNVTRWHRQQGNAVIGSASPPLENSGLGRGQELRLVRSDVEDATGKKRAASGKRVRWEDESLSVVPERSSSELKEGGCPICTFEGDCNDSDPMVKLD